MQASYDENYRDWNTATDDYEGDLDNPNYESSDDTDREELEAVLYSQIHFEPNFDVGAANYVQYEVAEEVICRESDPSKSVDQESVSSAPHSQEGITVSSSSSESASDEDSSVAPEAKSPDAELKKAEVSTPGSKCHDKKNKKLLDNFLRRSSTAPVLQEKNASRANATDVKVLKKSKGSRGSKVLIQIGSGSEDEEDDCVSIVSLSSSSSSSSYDSGVQVLIQEAVDRHTHESESRSSSFVSRENIGIPTKTAKELHIEEASKKKSKIKKKLAKSSVARLAKPSSAPDLTINIEEQSSVTQQAQAEGSNERLKPLDGK